MSLLIFGSKSPGREIDVYLQPLIEELKNLLTSQINVFSCMKPCCKQLMTFWHMMIYLVVVQKGIKHVPFAWGIDHRSNKMKDTTNARLDLQDLKIRKNLPLVEVGNRLVKPHARYTLTSSEQIKFCKFLKVVKFLDELISNISRCVNANEGKISSFNMHDCHVLLNRLLIIGVRALLPKNVYTTITELYSFLVICASG